jgi:hypothetical protein
MAILTPYLNKFINSKDEMREREDEEEKEDSKKKKRECG